MKDALLALAGLLTVLIVAGWHIVWPWLKVTAAKHGVGLLDGSEMMLFPTTDNPPKQAMHFKLFGVERGDWFVGVIRSKTLVRQTVTPAKVKILGPND